MLAWLCGDWVKWGRKERSAILASWLTRVACMGNFCVAKKKIKNQNIRFSVATLRFRCGNAIGSFRESPVSIISRLSSCLDNWHLPPLAARDRLFVQSCWAPGTSRARRAAPARSHPRRGLVPAHLPLLKGSVVARCPRDPLQGASAWFGCLLTVSDSRGSLHR